MAWTRPVGALFIGACLMVTTVGCGDDGGSGDALSVAYADLYPEGVFRELVEEFEAEHPDVKIETPEYPIDAYFTALPTDVASGNAPDVMLLTVGYSSAASVSGFAADDLLLDITDESWVDVPERSRLGLGVDDRVYGLPTLVSAIGAIYNVDLFERENLEVPATFDDLLALCEDLSAAGVTPIAIPGAALDAAVHSIIGLAASDVYSDEPEFDQRLVDGEATFSETESWHSTLENFVAMKDAGCFSEAAAGDTVESAAQQMVAGEAAMMVYVASGIETTLGELDPGFELAMFPLPGETADATQVPYGDNAVFAISADTSNEPAALEFLEFITRDENLARLSTTGLVPLGGGELPPEFELVGELVDQGRTVPWLGTTWPQPDAYAALQTGAQQLLTGQASPDQVLQAMDDGFAQD